MNLLTNLFRAPTPKSVVKAYRPQLEGLEARALLAVSALASNGTLTITGDAAANNVSVVQNDALGNLTVKRGTIQIFAGQSSAISKIDVDLFDGKDEFTYTLAAGSNFTQKKTIDLDLGTNNDKATLRFVGASTASPSVSTIAADLTLDLRGGTGLDNMTVIFGRIDDDVKMTMDGGNDADIMKVQLRNHLADDADVELTMNGGTGNDTIEVNAKLGHFNELGQFQNDIGADIDEDACLDIDINGGGGTDVMDVYYQGLVEGDMEVDIVGGAGANDKAKLVAVLEAGSDGDFDFDLNAETETVQVS